MDLVRASPTVKGYEELYPKFCTFSSVFHFTELQRNSYLRRDNSCSVDELLNVAAWKWKAKHKCYRWNLTVQKQYSSTWINHPEPVSPSKDWFVDPRVKKKTRSWTCSQESTASTRKGKFSNLFYFFYFLIWEAR